MAYDKNRFATVGGAQRKGTAPQVFSYAAPAADGKAVVIVDGYFNDSASILSIGDFILVSYTDAAAGARNGGLYTVSATSPSVVTKLISAVTTDW